MKRTFSKLTFMMTDCFRAITLSTTISFLLLFSSSSLAQDEEKTFAEIDSCFKSFKSYTQTKHGAEATNYITNNSFDYFEKILVQAKRADRSQVITMDYFDRYLILGSRHSIGKSSLMKMSSGKELFVAAVNHGLLEMNETLELSFDDPLINNNYAKVHPKAFGLDLLHSMIDIEFRKENRKWKLDYAAMIPGFNIGLPIIAKMTKMNESEFILSILEGITGRKPTQDIWEPIGSAANNWDAIKLAMFGLLYILSLFGVYRIAKWKNLNILAWMISAVFFHLFVLLTIIFIKPKSYLEQQLGSAIPIPPDPKLEGIKGWLLVFSILLILVHPAFLIRRLIETVDITNGAISMASQDPTPPNIHIAAIYNQNLYIYIAVFIVIIILTIITFISILKRKSYAVLWSKIYVWSFGVLMIIIFYWDAATWYGIEKMSSLFYGVDKDAFSKITTRMAIQIVLSLAFLLLWDGYFRKSVRTRQTFQKLNVQSKQQSKEL
jgi:hypothetical protein